MATTDPTSLTSASASAAAPTATLAPAPQSAPTSSPASASVPELPVHPVQIPVQTSTYTPFNHVSTADDLDTTLSSDLQPLTNATLTIRCIKSFEYRTEKNLVLKGLDLLTMTVGELMERCREALRTTPGFKAYRTVTFDTLKLYTQAHSHKTMNLIINLDHDEWILSDMSKTLAECGAVNETEYSYFNREMYEEYKKNPQIKWD